MISKELRDFFSKDSLNSIEFWNCPSYDNWTLHSIVNKETKKFDFFPLYSCKLSWDFDKKNKYDNILIIGK